MSRKKEALLRRELIRVAHRHPDTRPQLVPLIRKYADLDDVFSDEEIMGFEDDLMADDDLMAGRTWGNPDPHSKPDDNVPYRHWPKSPDAGADGSAQRKKYNQWYRKNVCPSQHKTNCGAPWLAK